MPNADKPRKYSPAGTNRAFRSQRQTATATAAVWSAEPVEPADVSAQIGQAEQFGRNTGGCQCGHQTHGGCGGQMGQRQRPAAGLPVRHPCPVRTFPAVTTQPSPRPGR